MTTFYTIKYMNKKHELITMHFEDLDEAKSLYKTLCLDSENENVRFFITNKNEIEMQYDELFEKTKIER